MNHQLIICLGVLLLQRKLSVISEPPVPTPNHFCHVSWGEEVAEILENVITQPLQHSFELQIIGIRRGGRVAAPLRPRRLLGHRR